MLEAASNIVTIVGFPLLLVQLAVSDRARAAGEMIDQFEIVASNILETSVCPESEFRARSVILFNFLESIASLLNRWLISIWSRKLWHKFLVDTLKSLDDDQKFGGHLRQALTSSDYASLRFFISHNKDRFSSNRDLAHSAAL